jgi:signal transduction histidine kinase/HPt (histidine-containing phosphotransfer) domain-containing protein/ActR/RegA family two-component response regulator
MASPLQPFLRQLGYALFQYLGDGRFTLLGDPPPWLENLWGPAAAIQKEFTLAKNSIFLESFLPEAESFWDARQSGVLDSGSWIEKSAAHAEAPLRATALLLEGRPILAVRSLDSQDHEGVQLLQAARNSVLAQEKLLREVQKKEILIHCIIHDLSQPLSAMSVALDCVSAEPISPRAAEFLDLGKRASLQQQNMIREVLQAFSAELGAAVDTEQSADNSPDLLKVAGEVVKSFSAPFAVKNVRVQLTLPAAPAECRVTGEASRLHRVFANLLENALRYSPEGSRVSLGFELEQDFCTAYVDDEGPGLPRDRTPVQIFGLFSKGKEGAGKAGLGLYFCRITVERWGGTIGCASLPEKGSRFWFRLPKTAGPVPPPRPGHDAQISSFFRNTTAALRKTMRVLLADDQEDIRKLTSYQLERFGHIVTSVSDGQAALEAAQHHAFDVILLDEEMPGLTGVQVARALRENPLTPSSQPILIALTGNNAPEDCNRLLAAGFNSVLSKPFRLEALTSMLSDPAHLSSEACPGASPQPGSLEDLLKRVGDDKKLLHQMIATFSRDAPKRLAAIRLALQKKDGEQLASFAHALKGSVSLFGATLAHQQSEAMQDFGRAADFRQASRLYPQLQEEIAQLVENLRGYVKQTGARSLSVTARAKEEAASLESTSNRMPRKSGARRKK